MTTCACAILNSSSGSTPGLHSTRRRAEWVTAKSVHRCSNRSACGSMKLINRVVVSPMDMYRAVDGLPNDFHLVHLGGKALGGAGLVMTEMVCVSSTGRITPGCTGIWTDEQAESLAPAHRVRPRRVSCQDRHPDRTLRSQGLDPVDVGRHRSAATAGQLGGRGSVTARLPNRRQPSAARTDRARSGRDHRAVRRRCRACRASRIRPARTALRARVPALILHLAA